MYVESFWILILAGLVIYLVWRVWKLKKIITSITNWTDSGIIKKQLQIQELCGLIEQINARMLSKVPQKTRRIILKEESREIIRIFEKYHVDGIEMDGQYTQFESSPYDQINTTFDSFLEDDAKHTDNITYLTNSLDGRIKPA